MSRRLRRPAASAALTFALALCGGLSGCGPAADLAARLQEAAGGWLGEPPLATWEVQRGESLGGIAKRHGVSVEDLRAANGLRSDLIHPGDVLRIPRGGEAPPAAPSGPTGSVGAASGGRARPAAPAPPRSARQPLPPLGDCAPGPSLGEAEAGMAASEGLEAAEVRAGVEAVLPAVASCVEGAAPSGRLQAELRIRCDGVVGAAEVAEHPGWESELIHCVLGELSQARFPKHSLPDGDRVVVPVSFR